MNGQITKPIDSEEIFSTPYNQIEKEINTENSMTSTNENRPLQKKGIYNIVGLDAENACNKLDLGEEFYLDMLKHFCSTFAGHSAKVTDAIEKNNTDEALSLIHETRGVAANLGAAHLHQAADKLEKSLKSEASYSENLLGCFVSELNMLISKIELSFSEIDQKNR